MMKILSLQLSLIVLVCFIVSLHAYSLYSSHDSYQSDPDTVRWQRVPKSRFKYADAVEPQPGDKEYLEKLVRYLMEVGRK